MREVHELLEPRRRAGDLRPRPGPQHRLLHGSGVRGLRPRPGRCRSAAAGATTTCLEASGARCPPSGSRWTSNRCTSRCAGEERGTGVRWLATSASAGPAAAGALDGLTIAVPRGALFNGTVTLLAWLGLDTDRAAQQRPQAAVRGHRRDHDAPVRRAHLRGGWRRGSGDHRQGRAAGAGCGGHPITRTVSAGAAGLRAARPRLWTLHDGVRQPSQAGRGPGRRGAAAARA